MSTVIMTPANAGRDGRGKARKAVWCVTDSDMHPLWGPYTQAKAMRVIGKANSGGWGQYFMRKADTLDLGDAVAMAL